MFFIAFVCPQQLLHGTLRSWLIFHKHVVLGLICFCRQVSHNLRQVLKLLTLVMLKASQMQYLSNLDQCSTWCTLELASNLALGYKVSSSHELSVACMSFKVIDLFLRMYIADPASSARGHKAFFCIACNTRPHPLNVFVEEGKQTLINASCWIASICFHMDAIWMQFNQTHL